MPGLRSTSKLYKNTAHRQNATLMSYDPATLIQESIGHLERLSALLAEEARTDSYQLAPLPPRSRISKEVLLTIGVLLPKLHAAHRLHAHSTPPKLCPNCDD